MSFRTEMNRSYETSRIRNNSAELTGVYSDMLIQTQAQKNWNWTRNYSMKYDLTKNLKTDFTASNIALVGEPRGVINKDDVDWYESYKDSYPESKIELYYVVNDKTQSGGFIRKVSDAKYASGMYSKIVEYGVNPMQPVMIRKQDIDSN